MSEKTIDILKILPAVRMTLSTDTPVICKLMPVEELNADPDILSSLEKLYPLVKPSGDTVGEIINEISDKKGTLPLYIYIETAGLICCAETKTAADAMHQNVQNLLNNQGTKDVPIPDNSKGRVAGKIIIVTGAAQGFGKGIATDLFEEGANIVIADLNEKAGMDLEEDFNGKSTPNKTMFVKTDVSDPKSVESLIFSTVNEFGGLDALISNAGVLRAGGLDEMDPSTFEFMTKVNYTGYFYCAKYASEVMKTQKKYSKDSYFDIIQINSKSGLKGSKKNFAYAGGKFGGIGLTQSFALELMPERIKVNSICPGNFFDGPLWSDPEKGLFVQYLNAGKVPGATSIQDVKAFYEAQVPAGRGCEVKDVTRAILYVIEQEYETGQAIPVTGGQNMLN